MNRCGAPWSSHRNPVRGAGPAGPAAIPERTPAPVKHPAADTTPAADAALHRASVNLIVAAGVAAAAAIIAAVAAHRRARTDE